MIKGYSLLQNWEFKISAGNKRVSYPSRKIHSWHKASVPGTIHTDLLKNKIISDPFIADNEEKIKWITQSDWQYQTRFDLPRNFELNRPIDLIFKGLDTFAEVSLNGQLIGRAENMFRVFEWEVHEYLKPANNILKLVFKNPFEIYEHIHHENKDNFNRNLEPRAYLRKAQYSFGWDWGPALPTAGIWRPVYLEQHDGIRIKALRFTTSEIKNNQASIKVKVDCEGNSERISALRIRLSDQRSQYEKYIEPTEQLQFTVDWEIPEPQLWWPNGMGKANMYDLEVAVLDRHREVTDLWQKKVGIRTIELKQKEANRPVFRFLINGEPLYIKGANWIPADSFLPRVNYQKYQQLLTQACCAHLNMIRVWGGGIYEDDIFYQLCDELGLLVWQDFMFACSPYPEYPEFLQNVQEELKQNILRLQHHPSLAIWCGNNENEWIWQRSGNAHLETMPGFSIFHQLIPSLLEELDKDRPYWPSSPFGDDADPNSVNSGNRHQWDIWSFWMDYTQIKDDKSLFVTEFGFQAPANRQTLEAVIPPAMRYIQSRIFEWHNKQIEGNERLIRFLAGHLPVCPQWPDYIYLTQLNQGFALKTCLEHWRRRWPETSGSIIWQLNDCWPVSSWSLIDSRLHPKLSYFFVSRVFSPCFISFEKVEDNLQVSLSCEQKQTGILNLVFYQLSTGKKITGKRFKLDLQKYGRKNWNVPLAKLAMKEDWIAIATVSDDEGASINRNYFISGRWKHQRIADAKIKIQRKNKNLKITCKKPAYFVDLYHPKIHFENRAFILLPGEEKIFSVPEEISIKDIQVFMLNSYLRH